MLALYELLNVGLIKKRASTSVATEGAWYHCRRTQKVNLLTISILCNMIAQIYYKIQNTCALLRK